MNADKISYERVEWNGGMERWNGIVEWNSGIVEWWNTGKVEKPRLQITLFHYHFLFHLYVMGQKPAFHEATTA